MLAYNPCVFINNSNGLILKVYINDINVIRKDIQVILNFKT
jgi:hypothetical protein